MSKFEQNDEQSNEQALRFWYEPPHCKGDTWYNLVNGYMYIWTGSVWRSTGECPYGENPMGF